MNNGLGVCAKASSAMQIIGYVLMIFKIVLPIIIIILASTDLSKAVRSGDEKDIKESINILIKRLLIGIAIFLLPSVVRIIYYSIAGYQSEGLKNDAAVCIDCLTMPSKCSVTNEKTVLK